MQPNLATDDGYMRICDRIFCQNLHIAYICEYNHRMAMTTVALSILRPLNIFGGK